MPHIGAGEVEQHLKRTLNRHLDSVYRRKTNSLFFTELCANMTYEPSCE